MDRGERGLVDFQKAISKGGSSCLALQNHWRVKTIPRPASGRTVEERDEHLTTKEDWGKRQGYCSLCIHVCFYRDDH